MPKMFQLSNFSFSSLKAHWLALSFVVAAALVLGWVASLVLNDISVWGKDLGTIFFGSRTGEPISLGIGMGVIHYFAIGMALLGCGIFVFIRERLSVSPEEEMLLELHKQKTQSKLNTKQKTKARPTPPSKAKKTSAPTTDEERFFSGCLHHFGYLSSRPKDSPIPPECIICNRLGDCMVATVYVKKINE